MQMHRMVGGALGYISLSEALSSNCNLLKKNATPGVHVAHMFDYLTLTGLQKPY